VLLAELTRFSGEGDQDALIVLEEQIGVVRIGVRRRGSNPSFAEFDAPKLPEPLTGPAGYDALASALGLLPSEIGFENHKPSRYSAGLPCTFVPVRDVAVIARAQPNLSYWEAAFGRAAAVFVYCRETVHTNASFHARMFAPGLGVPEDPATGSAAAAFAAVVHRYDQLTSGTHEFLIEQGYEMGRPSQITLEIGVNAGQLKGVRIGGYAVRVSEGTILV
jgi:trans-2,3-dihydro-3-hydroxyanthranilate isomerase